MSRPGFALITVLWVIVVASTIAVAGAGVGADAAAAHKNRINATRARWRAQGCANRVKYAVDAVLGEAPSDARDSVWRTLDTAVARTGLMRDTTCVAQVFAAGTRLNVNAAAQSDLERMFTYLELPVAVQLAAATADWIDVDDVQREGGAERALYESLARRGPRNGPIADVAELRHVIGMDQIDFGEFLTTDAERVSLTNAPLAVLAALPGFGAEVLDRIAEWRATGKQVTNLLVLAGSVSSAAEQAIINAYPDLVRATTIIPDSWYVVASSSSGRPAIASSVEWKLGRTQSGSVVIRRRVW